MELLKRCPVCDGIVAVWDGDRAKYGDRVETNWHRFIALKYCCAEHAAITTAQSKYLSNKRRRRERKEERELLLDILQGYRQESKRLKEEIELQRKLLAGLQSEAVERRDTV